MIGDEFTVHFGIAFAKANGREATVVRWQLLLDYVGLDGDAKMIGLGSSIGGIVVIFAVFLKG